MSILRVMIALALPASNCFLSFSNSRLNSPQRINLPRESNSFTNVRSRCTSNTSPVELKDYLVEFRATNDLFRLDEFRDCAQCCGVDYELTFRPVIIDMFTTEPVCTYVRLPNDKVAQQIAARSCIIRSIIEVWGDSVDLHELVNTTTTSYMNEFKIHFKTIPSEKNTWRINFRHYGKSGYSGMSYREKVEFLKNFNEVFTDINGQVDLSTPNTKLVYMEDWFDYQNSTNVFYQQTLEANSEEDIEKAKEVLKSYVPRRRLFGRLVAKGPKIASTYDVRTRPYIGTTTMDALVSHITANAGKALL
jgi:tRNA G10  N-methylase Trm11